MTNMRRQLSPREILDRHFRELGSIIGKALIGAGIAPDMRDNIADRIEGLRTFAVSTADGAPALPLSQVMDIVAEGDSAKIERFVLAHLHRQVPLLHIEGVPPAELVEAVMMGLRGPDDLSRVARTALEGFPDVIGLDNAAWALEGVIREALGLDGRVPEKDGSPDLEAWSALSLRMALQRDIPIIPSPDGAMPGVDPGAMEAVLAAIGLPDPQDGMMRDEIHHVAMDSVARDTLARIEKIAGGQLDPAIAAVLSTMIIRAGSHAGPKVEISAPEM